MCWQGGAGGITKVEQGITEHPLSLGALRQEGLCFSSQSIVQTTCGFAETPLIQLGMRPARGQRTSENF